MQMQKNEHFQKALKECSSAKDTAETAYLEAMGTIKTGF